MLTCLIFALTLDQEYNFALPIVFMDLVKFFDNFILKLTIFSPCMLPQIDNALPYHTVVSNSFLHFISN